MLFSGVTVRSAAVGMVAASIIMAYAGGLSAGFHWDDTHAILRNPAVRSVGAAFGTFIDPGGFSAYRLPMVRPLTILTYAFNYRVGNFNPLGWHILNLLFHLFASLAAMGITTVLLERVGYSESPRLWGGMAAGLVFAVHPVGAEAINYFSARSALLAGAFCLAGIYCHLRHTDAHGNGRRIAAAACFIAGVASRESAAVFPAIVAATELILPPPNAKSRFKAVVQTWPYWISLVVYMGYRRLVLGVFTGKDFVRGPIEQIGIDLWAVGLYHKLLAFPWSMNVHHPAPECMHTSALLWIGAAIVCLEVIVFIGLFKKKPLPVVGLAVFYIGLLPTLAIPLNFPAAEHRLYLSMAGAAVMAGWAMAVVSLAKPRYAVVALLAVTLALAIATRFDNRRWLSDLTLWRAAVKANPGDYLAWTQYGRAMKDSGNLTGAMSAYRKSLTIRPTGAAYNNLSVACDLAGDKKCSFDALDKALSIEPNNPNAHMNLGLMSTQKGRLPEAELHFLESIRLLPVFPEAHKNLAVLYLKRKPPALEQALKHLEISFRQDPYQKGAAEMRKAILELRRRVKKRLNQ